MFRYIKVLAARILGWFQSSANRASALVPSAGSAAKPAEDPAALTPSPSGHSPTRRQEPTESATGHRPAAAWLLSDALLSPHVLAQGYICKYVQPVQETGAVYVITVLLDGKLIVRGQLPEERNLVRSALGN